MSNQLNHITFREEQQISFSKRQERENNRLSAKEKQICEYLSQNSSDVIHMSITELSDKCSTSEAALVRLAQKLGYKGFQALKISIAQESIHPESQIYEKLSPNDTIPAIVQKVFNSNVQALNDTLKVLEVDNVAKAVQLIKECNRLIFYGVGGSNIIAQDGQHKFMRIGYLASVFSDTNLQLMSSVLLQKGDVVIAISHSGASSVLLEIVYLARKKGAKIITITNYSRCPLLKYSDIPLFTSSPETAFKPEAVSSRIAELSIIDSLFIGVSLKQYDKALDYIQQTRNAQASKKI
ncbi:MAG: MurR/RpiR family transcriptional regulator [Sphaerochaetaceae bacterium]